MWTRFSPSYSSLGLRKRSSRGMCLTGGLNWRRCCGFVTVDGKGPSVEVLWARRHSQGHLVHFLHFYEETEEPWSGSIAQAVRQSCSACSDPLEESSAFQACGPPLAWLLVLFSKQIIRAFQLIIEILKHFLTIVSGYSTNKCSQWLCSLRLSFLFCPFDKICLIFLSNWKSHQKRVKTDQIIYSSLCILINTLRSACNQSFFFSFPLGLDLS